MSMIRNAGAMLALALLALEAHAAGTAAGTNIQNIAQVSYTVGASTVTATSNPTTVTVAEILDVNVTIANATVTVSPSATGQQLIFTVTNTGNGSEAFNLAALSAGVTGDNFDPTLASTPLLVETSGSFVAYSAPVTLAPDASVRVMVVNDIPSSVTDGQRGRSQLTATATTGSGTAGSAFSGAGTGGVDAVVGSSGAQGVKFGEYLVEALSVAAVKSQTIVDQFGGARPVPGARINYQIVVTATGTGTATAAQFTDPIPPNTTFVPGSLHLNSTALSDAADADAGQFIGTPSAQVRVTLGNLSQASGPQTVTFAVTIN
jgi:uncharacterized repeat protein (TIGR01451 family)